MLLSLMRKHAKSWLIKSLIGIIGIVFVFYFGYSFRAKPGTKIAYVNGELISGVEYQKAYRNLLEEFQRQYRGVWSESLLKSLDLKNRTLEVLISRKLVSQEARRIGLDVTEEELQAEIMGNPAFQSKGRFDEGRYRSLLDNSRMKPEEYEASIAQELLQRKLEQFLTTFLPMSEKEVLDHYTFVNQKMKIGFVKFQPEAYKASVKIDKVAIEKSFEENKEQYRIPEKIKISYIVVDPEEFKEKIQVTEKQIKDYYEENLAMFKEKKQVRARHILFKAGEDASAEEVKKAQERAASVLARARQGEDFAGLVKGHSEGPGATEGGDLGYFSAGQMQKPFEDAAFRLKKGEISDLVRTSLGFHIIKAEDVKEARTRSLEEVREEIAKAFFQASSSDLAHEKALSLVDQMPFQVDLAKYAAGHKLQARQTGFFSQEEEIPDILGDDKMKQAIFALQKDEVSEVIEYGGRFYIIQVSEKNPSTLPPLEQVYEKVKEDLSFTLAMVEAKAAAGRYLAKLKEGQDWRHLAGEMGVKPERTDFFTRQGGIPGIGYDPAMMEEGLTLSEKKRYPERLFEKDKAVYVFRWEGQEEIDKEKYQQEKEMYRTALARARQAEVLQGWIVNLRNKAKIEIVHPLDGGEMGS